MIDMFLHPLSHAIETQLFDLSHVDWHRWSSETLKSMDKNNIMSSGVCIMDSNIINNFVFLSQLKKDEHTQRFWYTLMPDFRIKNPYQLVEQASISGFKGITFHSYLQKIAPSDYALIADLAKFAYSLGMFTGICTAYGGKRLYDFHSLPLAVEILKEIKGPLILYHAGGANILEALLLCEMWPNLYLETSFSLSYWLTSSVELDIAFSIRKLGANRFMFGSDAPFVRVDKAISDHSRFLDRHGFSQSEGEMLLGGTARSVFPFINYL